MIEQGKERNIKAKIDRGQCKDCELKITRTNATMFEWDHKNPSEKEYGIAKMNMRKDELFYKEIEKCDMVCSNCHAIRTKSHFESKIIKKKPNNKEMLYNKN